MTAQGRLTDHTPRRCSQPVKAATQVHRLRRNVDPHRRWEHPHHARPSRTSSTRPSSSDENPHALVRACRPTTTPRSRPSRLLSRLLARLPPGEPDETVHSPSTRLAVAPTTEPAAGRSTRTPWRTPRHASHYAAMTTQHSAHPPLPSAASLSLSISPLSFASTSLASFVPRLQWRAHKGCLGSDVSGTWWERTLTSRQHTKWPRAFCNEPLIQGTSPVPRSRPAARVRRSERRRHRPPHEGVLPHKPHSSPRS